MLRKSSCSVDRVFEDSVSGEIPFSINCLSEMQLIVLKTLIYILSCQITDSFVSWTFWFNGLLAACLKNYKSGLLGSVLFMRNIWI